MGGAIIGEHRPPACWEVGHYAEREHARVSQCVEPHCDQGLQWISQLSTEWQCSLSRGPTQRARASPTRTFVVYAEPTAPLPLDIVPCHCTAVWSLVCTVTI